MRDEKILRERLEQLRGQLLQWGTPELMVFTTTKDELRGWIRALEWVIGKTARDRGHLQDRESLSGLLWGPLRLPEATIPS